MKFLIPGRLDTRWSSARRKRKNTEKKNSWWAWVLDLNWKQDQDICEQTKQFLEKKTAQSMGSNLNRMKDQVFGKQQLRTQSIAYSLGSLTIDSKVSMVTSWILRYIGLVFKNAYMDMVYMCVSIRMSVRVYVYITVCMCFNKNTI